MAGTWSCNTTTPDRFPTKDLFHIIREAWQGAPMMLEALIIDEAAGCALMHAAGDSGSQQSHCDYVLAARDYANAADWTSCIAALKHLGPVPVGTPVVPTTTWPCDTGAVAADADVDLFTVIQLANFNAPAAQRSEILDRATHCALSHGPTVPPLDEVAHCDKVHIAKERAQAEDWVFCIEALDHGGGVRRRVTQRRKRDYKVVATRVEEMFRKWSRPMLHDDDNDDADAASPD